MQTFGLLWAPGAPAWAVGVPCQRSQQRAPLPRRADRDPAPARAPPG